MWNNKKYKFLSELDEGESAFIGYVQYAQREARDMAVGSCAQNTIKNWEL